MTVPPSPQTKGARIVTQEAPLQPLDLFLTGLSSTVAVYAAAASLASDKNAQFFMWVVLTGTLCSSLVVFLLGKTQFSMADATAYTVVALVSVFGISALNAAVPDPIYTGPLTMAGVLSWMLALGSFSVWRDQTMLFQAVPAVALFGLVGCYDTFRASVVYFFGFLICQAILLSRAHGRAMLRQARSSGTEALEMAVMRRGPWRWMAGPEWALASALTIVLISAIGAPILRDSASGFSGLVRYTPPLSPLMQASVSGQITGSVRVGSGPNSVRDTPMMRAELPYPTYLRGLVFGRYDNGSWLPVSSARSRGGQPPPNLALNDVANPSEIAFKIEPLEGQNGYVPVPGVVEKLVGDSASSYFLNSAGSYSTRSDPPYPPLEGYSIVPSGRESIKTADLRVGDAVPDYLEHQGIPIDVVQYAQQVTKGAKTDYEKAIAIRTAIESTGKYNLNAARTPEGQDPVSYFLFKGKEGYCDLFASSMTLMARAVGLPARYVTGYYPFATAKDDQGRYIVRQKDAHAWCEILFRDSGWTVFDATEGAESVDGGGRGSVNDQPFWQAGWFLITVVFSSIGALGYIGMIAIGSIRKYWSSVNLAERQANQAKARMQARIRKQYVSFERELRRAVGRPRGLGETIMEYTAAAKAKLAHRAALGSDTSAAFVGALYSPSGVDDVTIDKLRDMVKGFRRSRRSKGQ